MIDETDAWPQVAVPEAWAGELRVNVIRLLALVLFYGRHLLEWALADPGTAVRGRYHLLVTLVIVAWSFEAVMVQAWLSRRRYDPWLKYLAVVWDTAMVTGLCAIAGGPRTPLLLLYFVVIASAPLRLSLRLVWAGTASAMLGYWFLLGYYAFYVIGVHRYYATPEVRIPRSQEAITLLAMLVCGAFAGQLVRQSRRISYGHVALATSEGGVK